MSFDGIFTHAMTTELNETIVNGRISKIHQPYENEIILVIRNQGANHKLLLSAHPAYARMQLTTIEYQNPQTPPNFCMMLRKHLEGSILQSIKQIENDRTIHFSFAKRNELGDLEDLVLIVELMGRHSTIVLVNHETKKILDCIKHIGPSQNSYRTLLPGATYINPPVNAQQKNPWIVDQEYLFALLSTATELTPQLLQESFQGLGFDTAQELVYRLKNRPNERLQTWHHFFEEIEGNIDPRLTMVDKKEFFTPIPYNFLGNEGESYETLSQLLDAYYEGKAERERVKQQAGELIRRITNEHKKTKAKIKKLERSLKDTENAEEYRQKGELLTTFLHHVQRGMTEITLDNYYNENQPIKIALREDLTPAQNAQKYFQRYGKLKNSVKILTNQINVAKQEVLYLRSVLDQLDLASPLEIDYIREELIQEKYLRPKHIKGQHRKQNKSRPEKYRATDGTTILVGKNNLQNDQLTLRSANKNHYWLHAKDIPGSHVIVESDNPDETALMEAAKLAAYFSKYRLSSSVPIDYVQVRHVKKPNGAKPGYVIYDNQKTLFVTPDKELIEKMRIK